MSRQLETRGGWRIQNMTRVAGFLLLAPLVASPFAGAPVAATGAAAVGVRASGEPPAGATAAICCAPTHFVATPHDGLRSRREPALRGAALRAPGPRPTSLRHPVGFGGLDAISGSGFTLQVGARGVAVPAGAAWRTAEGVSHADGIRGPPAARTAAPRMSSRP